MARLYKLLVRMDTETERLLGRLATEQGVSRSDAVRLAIREVSALRGLLGPGRPGGRPADAGREGAEAAI